MFADFKWKDFSPGESWYTCESSMLIHRASEDENLVV